MNIASANTAGTNPQKDFVVGGGRVGKISERELRGSSEEERFHAGENIVAFGAALTLPVTLMGAREKFAVRERGGAWFLPNEAPFLTYATDSTRHGLLFSHGDEVSSRHDAGNFTRAFD